MGIRVRIGRRLRTWAAMTIVQLTVVLLASSAHAETKLIAIGSISGTYEDLAVETAAPLENGIPGNRLGGVGSSLTHAGGNLFLALPDRGPNAKPYNSAVDDTASYIPRFHTLSLSLAPSDPGSVMPFVLTPMLLDTTLLSSRAPLPQLGKVDWPAPPPPGTPALLTTRDVLRFATLNGAIDLRLDKKTGSLTPGKEADIIILDATRINVAPSTRCRAPSSR